MKSLGGEELLGGLGGGEGSTGGAKVRDQLLEQFLQVHTHTLSLKSSRVAWQPAWRLMARWLWLCCCGRAGAVRGAACGTRG